MYKWILKKVFEDGTEVLDRLIEKGRKIKSYELLYAMYASIYVYVTLLYVIYNMMCNGFVFRIADYPLSMW